MSRQTTNKEGVTVRCSKALIPKKHFICPRSKSGNKFPGFKKCEGCGHAVWFKEK